MDSNLSFIQEGKVYNIELGTTFRRRKEAAFHTVRYDFKPASVDLTQQGEIVVGETNEVGETNVSIALPHQQGMKNSSVVYKGSKKPAQKECVLIYDIETKSFTLERVSSQIQVKKTRSSANPVTQPPVLQPPGPVKLMKKPSKKIHPNKSQKTLPSDSRKVEAEDKNELIQPPMIPSPPNQDQPPTKRRSLSMSSSSGDNSSSSDSSSSDNESSSSDESSVKSPAAPIPTSQLEVDLELSDTSDDSD